MSKRRRHDFCSVSLSMLVKEFFEVNGLKLLFLYVLFRFMKWFRCFITWLTILKYFLTIFNFDFVNSAFEPMGKALYKCLIIIIINKAYESQFSNYPNEGAYSAVQQARTTQNWDPIYATQEKFENAALFLRLGLLSTLIRHENGAFRKRSSNRRNLKTPASRFSVDGKHCEKGAFRKRLGHDYHVISPLEFSSNLWPMIVAFPIISGVMWTENIWSVFKFLGTVWTEPDRNGFRVHEGIHQDSVDCRPFNGPLKRRSGTNQEKADNEMKLKIKLMFL